MIETRNKKMEIASLADEPLSVSIKASSVFSSGSLVERWIDTKSENETFSQEKQTKNLPSGSLTSRCSLWRFFGEHPGRC